jgi:hypothetical protein
MERAKAACMRYIDATSDARVTHMYGYSALTYSASVARRRDGVRRPTCSMQSTAARRSGVRQEDVHCLLVDTRGTLGDGDNMRRRLLAGLAVAGLAFSFSGAAAFADPGGGGGDRRTR